jgi:hypothetical protein
MTGRFGQHLEFVNSVDQPSLLPGGVHSKPDPLGRGQPRAQRHLDVASVVFDQLVNAIH